MQSDLWKRCLEILPVKPELALEALYELLQSVLSEHPPRLLSFWMEGRGCNSRQDFVHELLIHLCENDFRRLRKAPQSGSEPPMWWLLGVANNLIKDDLRRRRRSAEVLRETSAFLAAAQFDIEKAVEDRETLETVNRCIRGFDEKTQTLLYARAHEMTLAEIAGLFGWADTPQNRKRAADALDYATRKLLRVAKVRNPIVHSRLAAWRTRRGSCGEASRAVCR